jgi:hypothetical protein
MAFKIRKKAPKPALSQVKDTAWPDNPDVRRWLNWAISLIGEKTWLGRKAKLKSFESGRQPASHQAPADFNFPVTPDNRAGWYLYQCELYLDSPFDFDMPQCSRIIPVVQRLGSHLDKIVLIPGATERMQRSLVGTGIDIDSILFELTVASAYSRRGFTSVEFLPESPSIKTPGLRMLRNDREFFVECKRKRKMTEYDRKERERGWQLSAKLRKELVGNRMPVLVDIVFHIPLSGCSDDVLDRKVVPVLKVATYGTIIEDGELTVCLRQARVNDLKETLRTSMVRIDGPLLYEKLYGTFERWRGYTGAGIFRPSPSKPRYITDVSFAAGCIWSCDAPDAMRAKAQHFRRDLAEAVDQLPPGKPSAVHLGFEAYDGEGVEAIRYTRLKDEMMKGFNPGDRSLEAVYCHLFEFESTSTENWAVNEKCDFWLRDPASRNWLLNPSMLVAEEN